MIEYEILEGARILFVGINPHFGSDRRGVPFSNNKMFWYILNMAGAIEEDRNFLRNDENLKKFYHEKFGKEYRFGLVNLVDRPTKDVSELRDGEERVGNARLEHIIKSYRPRVVCFVGKITYERFSGSKTFDFGWNGELYDSRIYVMHFPLRGKASVRVEEIKTIMKEQ